MAESITADHVLDVKGLKCPMPVLKTKVRFKTMNPGEILEVITTDPGSRKDLPAWADKTGNHLLGSREEGADVYHFFLQRPAEDDAIDAVGISSHQAAQRKNDQTHQNHRLAPDTVRQHTKRDLQ